MDVMPPFFERQGTAEARHRAPTYRERWVKNDGSGTLGYFGEQRSPGNWAAFFRHIGNCVKNRAASTEQLHFVKQFGSGSGHGPLFYFRLALIRLSSWRSASSRLLIS